MSRDLSGRSHFWDRLWPYTVIVASMLYLGLRLRGLWSVLPNGDEHFTERAIAHNWHGMFAVVIADRVHPPLYYVVLKLFALTFGGSEISFRLLSVSFACLAIFPTVAIARRASLGSWWQSGIIGIMAVNPFLIFYAQQIRMYSLILLLTTCTIWAWLKLIERPSNNWYWATYAILASALVWTQYIGWLFLAAQYLAALFFAPQLRRRLTVCALVVLLGCLPWAIIMALPHANTGGNLAWIMRPGVRSVASYFAEVFIAANIPHLEPLALIFCITLPIGWLLMRERGHIRPIIGVMLLTVIVPPLSVIVISYIAPLSFWAPRQLIGMRVPLLLLSALGISRPGQSARLSQG